MTERDEPSSITLDELKEALELRRVIFFEISSRRWNSNPDIKEVPPEEDDAQLRVLQKVEKSRVSVRCRMDFKNSDGHLIADAAAIFETIDSEEPKEVNLNSELLKKFTEEVGVPILFPYLREALHEGARKVRIKAPLLGIPRHGKIRLEPAEDGEDQLISP